MPAAKLDLLIEQGSTFKLSLAVKSGVPPTPVNLTGYSARMQVRSDPKSESAILSLSSDTTGILIDPIAGTINIEVPATVTSGIIQTSGVYDLEIESASGEVTRLVKGKVKIDPEVTR